MAMKKAVIPIACSWMGRHRQSFVLLSILFQVEQINKMEGNWKDWKTKSQEHSETVAHTNYMQ